MAGRIARVVSGGQTGVDRAALDAAIEHGREYGGWCPAGGWAEDLDEPPGLLARYPALREAGPDPDDRTFLNVRDSDATLIVCLDAATSPGTELAIRSAARLGRPLIVTAGSADGVRGWLASLGESLTLNVAGPRASEWPEGYRLTRELLADLMRPGP